MHPTETFSSDRRSILKGLAAAAVTSLAAPEFAAESLPAAPTGTAAAIATDKAYWAAVKGLYAVTPVCRQFRERLARGIMPRPVRREFIRQSDMINYQEHVLRAAALGSTSEAVRAKVAGGGWCCA